MTRPPIVDSHVHFWDPSRLEYPWLASVESLRRAFLPADLDQARGDVHLDAMVFVECDAAAAAAAAEVDFVEELAEDEPRIQAIVAHAPLELGDAVRPVLSGLRDRPLVKGVRRLLQDEPDPLFCLEERFVAGVLSLPEFGLTMDLCIRHPQLRAVTELARVCEDVTFVLDHAGKPAIAGRVEQPWRDQLRELARLDNVHCKLSGMVTEASHEAWTLDDLRPYVEHVIDCFGFERVLYGGDWPVVELAGGYRRWFDALSELVSACSPDEQARLFGGNARAFYRLPEPD